MSEKASPTSSGTLWQLPIIGSFKGMGYCIKTADDFHFVIDGGGLPEADYLTNFILDHLDGRVDVWFLTHPHKSHVAAFIAILNAGSVNIRRVVYSYVDPETAAACEPKCTGEIETFNAAVKSTRTASTRVRNGDRLKFGKCIVKTIIAPNVDNERNYVNNSGVIYKFNFKTASVLFLGDVGPEVGFSLMSLFRDELHCDILQMAHHGFYGVPNELYTSMAPRICLWPVRREIWPYDAAVLTGESSDIKKTYDHMCAIGVTEHYVSGIEGLSEIVF